MTGSGRHGNSGNLSGNNNSATKMTEATPWTRNTQAPRCNLGERASSPFLVEVG